MTARPDTPPEPDSQDGDYVVVARRYRPQSFSELVGQERVSRALTSALRANRVGHAYLFTGARGVGKTSAARILAKALNCSQGPGVEPCNQCDICESIAAGEDVDVLEIDGASNRGIDEIRQLRSNVNIRPSRARFKVYIIDEVHMLTTPAFNALLKTLEEPPEHVKFVFCTTDPEKIPITVRSRCQRYDFAGVRSESIVERLRSIVASEGGDAEVEALQMLARQAGGSMRDSQSLLEQLLAFSEQTITVADVHALLGTADAGRIASFTAHLIDRDAAACLEELDRSLAEGVDPSLLAEQLVTSVRDLMVAAVGADARLLLQADPDQLAQCRRLGQQLGFETLLAMLQILDQALTRMRQSSQHRLLLEVALVRLCHLEQLDELPRLVSQLQSGGVGAFGPASAPQPAAPKRTAREKKTDQPAEPIATADSSAALTRQSAESVWKQVLDEMEDMASDYGACYAHVATSAPNRLVVTFPSGYTLQKEGCERPERKARIEQALSRITGRPMRVDFELLGDSQPPQHKVAMRPMSHRQRMRAVEQQPFVRRAMELFDAEVTRLEEPGHGRTDS